MSDTARAIGLTALALALTVFEPATSAPAEPFRVQSYSIDATFEPAHGRMSAVAEVHFDPASVTGNNVVFFLHGELRVDSIKVAGNAITASQELVYHEDDYSRVANRIEVEVGDVDLSNGLLVGYSGYFNPSVVSAISNYMRIDGDGVFLRSLGYSIWFPVVVDSWRDSHEVTFSSVTLRTPLEYRAVFAGDRVREFEDGGDRVSVWSAQKLELFDAQCTARRFDVLIDGGFQLYHLRDSVAREMAGEILAFTRRLESFYQAYYGRNAASSHFYILQMPKYGDIASGNVIGISDAVWNQFEATAWQGRTVAHELVHAFVSPPCSNELAAFVIEGFPSYFHLPALAEILGEPWYGDFLDGVERGYIDKRTTGRSRRGATLPPEKPIVEIGHGEIGVYKDLFVLNDRVRLFFDYLRRRMGNERFLRFSSDLLNRELLEFDVLVAVVEAHLPDSGDDVRRWLKTTDFPDRWRRVTL
jgi:hypothetical protein